MSELERPEPDSRRAVALVVGILAGIAFIALRFVVAMGGRQPLSADVWWHAQMLAMLTPPGVVLAWVPSIIGGTIGMFVIGIAVVALFLWRRRPWDAATFAVAIIVVVAIGAPMAAVVARVRPSDSLAETTHTSFPSGHTAVATTMVIILGLLLRRWYIWVIGVMWVLWMMWARTYLHAHWLSDVLAGLLEGIAVATLVWCAVEAVRDRRAVRSRRAAPTET
jgi:membrane-associated phospholipid phosphatase